jgi:hypothetical protein
VVLFSSGEDVERISCTGCDGLLEIKRMSRYYGWYLVLLGTDDEI